MMKGRGDPNISNIHSYKPYYMCYIPVELFTLKYFFYLFYIRPHWNALSPENIKHFYF